MPTARGIFYFVFPVLISLLDGNHFVYMPSPVSNIRPLASLYLEENPCCYYMIILSLDPRTLLMKASPENNEAN